MMGSQEIPPMINSQQNTAKDLRGFLETNSDIVTCVTKPVSIDDIGALSAQSEQPIVFENITEYPDYRMTDILVKHRHLQCRAIGVPEEDYLKTLAQRLRMPPRGFVHVDTAPVQEVVYTGNEADWTKLPVPLHSEQETDPYITTMNMVKDPETGFYNSCHAGTTPYAPREGFISIVTPHTHVVMDKYRKMGHTQMPIALVFGVHPAYEMMGNYSGLHMDLWGEMEMVGTILNQDVEMVQCRTQDMVVPAHAEIVVEGYVELTDTNPYSSSVSPSSYYLPKTQALPKIHVTAITMRKDRPIYRNHQTCPFTDHQILPRLCHEAMLYNRITEIGLNVKDVRFPCWGGALSAVIQVESPREGFINDALMACMGAPWLNTKMVVAISPEVNIDDPGEVYHAIATCCDPAKDIFVVNNTRGSLYDPSAEPIPDQHPWRLVGKVGIDATYKQRFNRDDFTRSLPKKWGQIRLEDYL